MRERDVADASSWEPWQHDYRFGVVLVMPPPHVASPIDALRQAYDQKSHAICSAHISVSDPLRRQMSDDAQEEIQELLRTVEPLEVHYDRPTASARRPSVAYPVSPQERFDELKCIIHQASSLKRLARVSGSSSNLTPHADSYAPVPPVRFLCAIAVVSDCKLLMALDCEVVTLSFASWNQVVPFLRRLSRLRIAA
jgi:hypothetical protein